MDQDAEAKNRRLDAFDAAVQAKVVRAVSPGWSVYAGFCGLLAAILLTLGFVPGTSVRGAIWFGVLVTLAILQAEVSRRIERERRHISGDSHVDVTTVWFVAGAALLGPGWAALLVVVTYAHQWIRVTSRTSWSLDRMLVSAAILVVSAWCASALLHLTPIGADAGPGAVAALPWLVLAAVVLDMVNAVLVAMGIFIRTRKRRPSDLFGTWKDNGLEVITLCLGVVVAHLLATPWPYMVVLIFPPLLILHRAALSDELEVIATTDTKTSTFNAIGWQQRAAAMITDASAAGRNAVLVMIDVDRFKRVNDTFGHPTGDTVLREIATTIKANVRAQDLVGRYGGEEFVVMLPDTSYDEAALVAERIRVATEELKVPIVVDLEPTAIEDLSVSIGMAPYPDAGSSVDMLIDAADRALYQAKETGRNRLVQWQKAQA